MYGFGGQWGYYHDWQIEHHLLTNRYYNYQTCRFLTRDPIGYAGGGNLYRYAGNSPNSFADPSGLELTRRDVAGVGGAALGSFFGGGIGAAVGADELLRIHDGLEDLGYAVGCYEGGRASGRDVFNAVWELFTGIDPNADPAEALILSTLKVPRSASDELVDIYGGIGANHARIDDARKGIARPRGGPANAAEHNEGWTESPFTSWTTEQGVAEWYATRGGPGGVVLHDRVPKSHLIPSNDIHKEGAVLRRGRIRVHDIWHR